MARVYQEQDMGMADIRAALVTEQGMADLCVYRTATRGMAHGDAIWFVCRERADAQVRVWFGEQGMAQLNICFVGNHSAAGWMHDHPLKGRFGRGF